MAAYSQVLGIWSTTSPRIVELTSDYFARQNFGSASQATESISWVLPGTIYSVELTIHPVDLTSDGMLVTQSKLAVQSSLARRLENELGISSCSPRGRRYAIGVVNAYIEWVAGNAAQPPQFLRTLWNESPSKTQVSLWLSKISSCTPILEAVRKGEPIYPRCKSLIEEPCRIGGSPPVWGGEFERAVCMLDSHTPASVREHIERTLRERRQAAKRDPALSDVLAMLECQLGKLHSWLLTTYE